MKSSNKNRKEQKLSSLAILLWAEFYKLSLSNPDLKAEIRKSREFYKPLVTSDDFKTSDWVIKAHLFKPRKLISVVKEPLLTLDPDFVYLAIPKSFKITTILENIKSSLPKIVSLNDSEVKKKDSSHYQFTEGKELKIDQVILYLEIYKLYLKLNKQPINRKFIDAVHQYYRSKRGSNIPSTLGVEGSIVNEDSVLRTIRRYIQKAKLLEKNAAKGDFPGKDYTD